MYILGINAYHADSSAAIFKDGLMIAATEEERFTRIKHWAGFPTLAIQFCLKEAGIGLADVDHITIGRDPNAKFGKKLLYLFKNPGSVKAALERRKNNKKVATLEEEFGKIDVSVSFRSIKNRIHNIEHHRSHLASAFFASPFEESAILSIDGSGDFTTTMIAVGRGNKIEVIDSIDFADCSIQLLRNF
jgi:carbamoyltransferase